MQRPHVESDLYSPWETVFKTLAWLVKDPRKEMQIIDYPQYKLIVHKESRVPDSLTLYTDDTWTRRLLYWAELKRLNLENWFDAIARAKAEAIISAKIPQLNVQAQFARADPSLVFSAHAYAFLICGPYWQLFHYQNDAEHMSPYFDPAHRRKNASKTRSESAKEAAAALLRAAEAALLQVAEAEAAEDEDDEDIEEELEEDDFQESEEPAPDLQTRPVEVYPSLQCIFDESHLNPDEELDLLDPNTKLHLNPYLIDAFRLILTPHQALTLVMQNVMWFDCIPHGHA